MARELFTSGQLPDASTLCAKILEAEPDHGPTLHLRGLLALRQGDRASAVRFIERAARSSPPFAPAHNDLGNLLMEEGRTAEAIQSYTRALRIRPVFPEASNNLGNACQIAGSLAEAERCYRQALDLAPDYAEAHRNLGSLLRRLHRLPEAISCFEKAVALNPGFAEAITQLVQETRTLCAWEPVERLTRRLVDLVETDKAAVNPFVFLSLDTTPAQQFRCARRWAREHLDSLASRPAPPPVRPAADRITLGYLSADFQEHATAHLAADLFGLHDRSRFRVAAYSYGADDGSPMRRRLMSAFDEFVDLEAASHPEAAARIRRDGVDILIDLKGYTRDARPAIVAMRPAPIQVNYLGYPGTMGASAVDYLIADAFVAPVEQQPYFSESLVHLPGCYQVNRSQRPIAARAPSREECGLPAAGFVFCCFNASYKLTAGMFDIWMRLLGAVPGSVLWLLAAGEVAEENLRREAGSRLPGGAARLLFAPSLPNPEHLARLSNAGLFLDTLPYNAHTLASDALWAGCPVITHPGAAFASRVAGTLLRAAGLAELIAGTLADYEALALRLARNPEELASLRARLAANRQRSPLFDCRRFARRLESAYETMWQRHLRGESPAPFAVPSCD